MIISTIWSIRRRSWLGSKWSSFCAIDEYSITRRAFADPHDNTSSFRYATCDARASPIRDGRPRRLFAVFRGAMNALPIGNRIVDAVIGGGVALKAVARNRANC
jgi:hypothetical protein